MNRRDVDLDATVSVLERAQVDVDDARAAYTVYRFVRRLAIGTVAVGAALALGAVALTVVSSLIGFDAGIACGALYGTGSIAATLGAIAVGSWSHHFHYTRDVTRNTRKIYEVVTPRRALLLAEARYRRALTQNLEES